MKITPRYHPGDRIGGRYLVHQVKMGGMGEVYLCLDLEEMYPYALKTFQQRYQSAVLRKAFEQEVVTWVALEKHPNIVRCFHMNILENQPFMVLEWIAGEEGKGADLRGWLRRGPLDLRTALEIIIDVVRGLLHAQEKQPGLVHRDLKPENILVAQGGLAKITDFGLAQIVEQAGLEVDLPPSNSPQRGEDSFASPPMGGIEGGRQSLVRKGGIAGTPAYMAPEQWRGEPLDERTDIYAVGCILYEMLTGQWPFRVDFTPTTPQQFQQWFNAMQAGHETRHPSPLPSDLPDGVGDLLYKCLAEKPTERLEDLTDFLGRLERLYRQQFGQAPPTRPRSSDFTSVDYNNRGTTYEKLRKYEEALSDYTRAIHLDNTDGLTYVNRGVVYSRLKRYEEAIVDFNQAIQIDPTDAYAYNSRGNTYSDLKCYEEALADFNRAIQFNPTYAKSYSNRGVIYFSELHEYEKAFADFTQAIQLDATYALAYAHRGVIYRELHQYDEAFTDYRQAIQLDPTCKLAYYNRGTTYHHLQRYDEAIIEYTQAIQLDPPMSQAYSGRGLAYDMLQQYEEALADFTQAIHIDPTNGQTYKYRGLTYVKLSLFNKALADYTHAVQLSSADPEVYRDRGKVYYFLHHHNKALIDIERAIELGAANLETYLLLADIYDNMERYDEAVAAYTQAIQIAPALPQSYNGRGAIYSDLERYDEALADFNLAIRLDPNYATAYFNLGAALGNRGEWREALRYFEKAAQLGLPQGAQYATRARQELGMAPVPQIDPAQQAFEAFQQADSAEAMQQAVARFPFMAQAGFIAAIEQAIAQHAPPEHRFYFEQRLGWLRQVAREQNQ